MEETLLYWSSQITSLEFWQQLLDSFEGLGPLVPIRWRWWNPLCRPCR